MLDTRNLHIRYGISLDDDCSAANHCEQLVNNWRKYRIPLYGGGVRIGAAAGGTVTVDVSPRSVSSPPAQAPRATIAENDSAEMSFERNMTSSSQSSDAAVAANSDARAGGRSSISR